MTETISEETVVSPVKTRATGYQTIEYLTYFFFGALEILLVFRFLFKLTGAATTSGFVSLVYGITGAFILPFEGIFQRLFAGGVNSTSVFEPSTIVAILVYAAVAFGIVKLVRILSGQQQAE